MRQTTNIKTNFQPGDLVFYEPEGKVLRLG